MSRSWQGLDPQLGNTPVQTAVLGSVGLAMGYTHEPQNQLTTAADSTTD